MHRALSSRWLNDALNIAEHPARLELPLFLCPLARSTVLRPRLKPRSDAVPYRLQPRSPSWNASRRSLHSQAALATTSLSDTSGSPGSSEESRAVQLKLARKLPRQCAGCGAFSQFEEPEMPGYYDLDRKAVRKFLGVEPMFHRSRQEDKIYEDALKHFNHAELAKKGVDVKALAMSIGPTEEELWQRLKPPLCDRCHFLTHHHAGESIFHPSIDSIRDTIAESPYKHNHVYHVLDAADFPMSLVPRITELLEIMPLRTRNRRALRQKFFHGQLTELSFVITRSDLLAPTKEQVDRMFPYLQRVLREVLAKSGQDVRLGNLFAVSSRRSWWTKELKETIWRRGGAGWMVGKANVGKSQLFEAVFPKGRMDWIPSPHQIKAKKTTESVSETGPNSLLEAAQEALFKEPYMDTYALLPPAPKEVQYPEMPLVSDLPGTTASPIRVPFGNGRGELIDLPGLERTGLERYVKKEHRLSLIMKTRIVPEQITVKPGQSLLIGGIIRITPRDPSLVMLTYAFTPIEPHVTRTDKAIGIQNQDTDVKVETIAEPGTGDKIALAGSFKLKWDVTRQRSGPLLNPWVTSLGVDDLPYRVLSTDILIEGVGWVEIVAQVRTRYLFGESQRQGNAEEKVEEPKKKLSGWEKFEAAMEDPRKKLRAVQRTTPGWGQEVEPEPQAKTEPDWPIVDVYSPEGKYISCREPMNGWNQNKPLHSPGSRKSRPRKSMKGVKKLTKKRNREREAAAASASF
ncbi:hypothetical protein F4810DRAFT_703985 [Camillea tinctor]|nr:hypothetical protein F4810DRAFT_703985 [Camillea tinctor]